MLREYERKSERKRKRERESSLNYSFSLGYYSFSLLPSRPFLYSFRSARKTTARDADAREMDQTGEVEKEEK